MERKYAYLGLGLAFVGGVALGAAGGYRYAFKKFYASYEEVLGEEIRQAKEFYSKLYKEEYPTPADAVEALIPDQKLEDATVALRKYANITVKPEDLEDPGNLVSEIIGSRRVATVESLEVEVERRNVFEQDPPDLLDKENRDLTKPYIVDYDEYLEHPEGHDELNLTYYAGDDVLGDDTDEPIDEHQVEILVGRNNLKYFGVSSPDDPHILLVRNEARKLDIEITRSDGKYAQEVLGFNHSDEPMMRRRPRWDDE